MADEPKQATLRNIRGLTVALVIGQPVRPQFTIGKPWCYFRAAVGPVAVIIVPFDLENIMGNYAVVMDRANEGFE